MSSKVSVTSKGRPQLRLLLSCIMRLSNMPESRMLPFLTWSTHATVRYKATRSFEAIAGIDKP